MEINDTWFGIEGESEGEPYILRGREDLSAFQLNGLYEARIDIVWTYDAEGDTRMPSDDVMQLMEVIEDSLVEQLEIDLQAVLALVFTGNGQRVWYWYCRDQAVANQRIIAALSAIPEKLPIEIFASEDADWSEYNSWID